MAVIQTGYGPKPSYTLAGGSPSTLARGSEPFIPAGGRSVTLTGDGWRTISFAKVYRSQPWIAAGCKQMTMAIARLPLHTFRYIDADGDARRRERQHGAAQLLRRPRPRQTGFHLRWQIALSLYVHGTYVGWKRRPGAGAPPGELWMLDWRYLIPLKSGTTMAGPIVAWEWRGEGVPGLKKGEAVYPEDLLVIGFEGPEGGGIGVSPLEQLGVTIRSEDAIQRHSEAYFRHGTRFGVAAILDKAVKADQVKRDGVREELVAAHGGVDQAYLPAVLGGGIVDLKPIGGQSAVEAELVGQRMHNREEAAGVIGIPGPLLGILNESPYGSLVEFHRMLYTTFLAGPLGLIVAGVQAQLIDDEPAWADDDVFDEFSLDDVLKGDTKERMEAYGVAIDHGILTLNNVRRRENEEPYGDPRADEPMIAANNVRPLSAIGKDDGATGDVANSILALVGKHAGRAVDRAVRRVGAGKAGEAWDGDRFRRELSQDLEAAGHTDFVGELAETFGRMLEQDIESAGDVEGVRALADRYATGGTA